MIKGIISSCVLILVIMLIRKLCRGKINQWLQYSLWAIVAIKLLVFPVPWVTSSIAIISSDSVMLSEISDSQAYVHFYGEDTSDIEEQSTNLVNTDNIDSYEYQNNGISTEHGEGAAWYTYIFFKSARSSAIAIWLIGSLIFAMGFLSENLKLRRMLVSKSKKYEQNLIPLEVYTVDNLPSPCLFGGKIYADKDLLEDNDKIHHILTHEYCHYLHKDNIWSAVRCLCLVLYWWNPLVWMAARYSKTDCELACDEAALIRLGDKERISYGRTLISLTPVAKTNYLIVASTMEGGKHSMKDRISFISKKPKVVISLCVLVVVLAVIVLIFTSITKPNRSSSVVDTETESQIEVAEATEEESQAQETQVQETTEDQSITEYSGRDFSVCTDFSEKEVLAYGQEISKIFEEKDWEVLAEEIQYPITIDDMYIDSKDKFLAKDWSKIFSDEFVSEIAKANTDEMWANWMGICMAGGYIWINQVDNKLYISSLNYSSEEKREVSAGLVGHWEMDYNLTTENLKTHTSIQEMFGTGIGTGAYIDFNEDGSYKLSIGLSEYSEGVYEETGDCVYITYDDEEGKSVGQLLTRGDQGDTVYIVYECDGESIYFIKMAE